MPYTVTLPDGYGYVVAIALGVIPLLSFGHGIVVGKYRAAAKIPYPNAYAPLELAKTNKAAYTFNCAQRAHAQLLENMPQTIAMALFAGAFYPQSTAALTAAWSVLRVLYAWGYIASDKPNGGGRYRGGLFWFPQLGLLIMSVYVGLTKLT